MSMNPGDNTVYVSIAGDAEQLANGLAASEKAAQILEERLAQVRDTIRQVAEAYQVTNAEAAKILTSPTMGGKAGLFDPKELSQALEQMGVTAEQAGANMSAAIAKYREDVGKAIAAIENLTTSEEGVSVEEAKLALGPLGTGEYSKSILNIAANAIQLRQEIATAGDTAQTAFGVTATESAAVFTASVQSAIVALKELQGQGLSLQQGKEALGPLGSGEYSTKVLAAAADTLKLSTATEVMGKTAQESIGVTAGDAIAAYRERVVAATAAIQQLITSEMALNVEEAKAALGANGTGRFSAPVLNAAAKAYETLRVEVGAATPAVEAFTMAERVGTDAIQLNNENVAQGIVLLQDMIAEIGMISKAQAGMALKGYGFTAPEINQMTKSLEAQGVAFTDTAKKKDAFKVNVGGLGDMMRYVRLGAFMIFMTALMDMQQLFKDTVKSATEFSNAIFGLDVAVRAWQRSGFDISLQEVHDKLVALQKLYPYFPMTEMQDHLALLINGVREFGLSTETTFKLFEDAMKASIITGKDLPTTIDAMINAVGSGRLQSIRKLGIPVSIDLEEEFIRAIDGTTDALTVQEKALASAGLIHQYFATLAEDTAKKQDVLAGKTAEANAAWTNFVTRIGIMITPLLENFKDLTIGLIDYWQLLIYSFDYGGNILISSLFMVGDAIHQLRTKGSIDIEALQKDWEKLMAASKGAALNLAFGMGTDPFSDAPIGTPKVDNSANDNIIKALEDAKTKIEKIQEDLTNNLRKLWDDYYRDLDKITLDGQRRQEELFLDYERNIQKIAADLQSNIDKEARSYQDKQLAEEVKYQDDVAKAKEKQQEKIVDDEKKFQDKIAQLRFDLENSLEDAIAARDARQITRLIRAEQAAEQSAKIAYDNEKRDRDETFAQELSDLQKQEDDRKKALEIDHQNRLREINIQNQEELDAALTKLNQQTDDLNKNLDQQRADRAVKYAQDKTDLLNATGKLVVDLTNSLADQYSLTAQGLAQLYQLYAQYYGPNGSLLTMMYNFYTAMASIGGGGKPSSGGKGVPMMASGGIGIANKATSVTFGEAGLEAAIFMPLNGSRMSGLGSFSNLASGGQNGKTVVEVWLSPDLQARIVNQAQSGIVDVFVKELG